MASIATAAAWVSGGAALARETPPPKLAQAQAGYCRMKVGAQTVIALSDGTIPLDTRLLFAKPEHVDKLLRASWAKSPLDASVNAFLIPAGERLILVDAGTGELLGPILNKLPASLAAAGYAPDQVTDILITHMHTDHTGGLTVGGKPVFPKAMLHAQRAEAEHWLNPANKDKAKDYHRHMFDEARAMVGPYAEAGRLSLFDGKTDLFPGISARPAPGHTPGHTFYVLESQGEKLVFWGDLVHVAEVQFPDPAVTIQFDSDPGAAARQRKMAFAEASRDGSLVAGAHLSFPGVGRLAKDGSGYRFLPAPYVNDAPA
jgi:glyoxylase-like metal-dependent hydrolase (beta-lactamase superfamily II)